MAHVTNQQVIAAVKAHTARFVFLRSSNVLSIAKRRLRELHDQNDQAEMPDLAPVIQELENEIERLERFMIG